MPDITGVRVTRYTMDDLPSVTVHEHGRDVRREDDGSLTVFADGYDVLAIYQPTAWVNVELLYAEPKADTAQVVDSIRDPLLRAEARLHLAARTDEAA